MRFFVSVSALSLLASGALAGEYTLDSAVSAATIYPQGATLVRTMAFDIPAGQHRLLISDIPYEFQRETLQILGGQGLVFGASRVISSRVQPDDLSIERREELEAKIASLEAQITTTQEESAAAGLVINAASARIKLLDSIGNQQAQSAATALETAAISVETLSALVSLVGNETLSALQDAQAARVEIARINRGAEALRQELQNAREDLARLVKPSERSYGLALDVTAAADTSGTLQISYVIDGAYWQPVYDFALDTETERLNVERKVVVTQNTGEDWLGALVTVSTSTPFDWQRFALPSTNLARFSLPRPPAPQLQARRMSSDAMGAAAEIVMVEQPATMAETAVNFQGITATYTLPTGTNVRSGDEGTLITLNSTEYDVALSARANMAGSSTAFLIAEMTNTSDEPFLPGRASYFRDGAFVSSGSVGMMAAGATAELGFGKVDGLTVLRSVLRREDGSSGVLTTSNDRVVDYAFAIENVTNRAWDVVVYDRVPVSEQEELVVDWSARPRPTETDVEGRRGVLAWAFALESGSRKTIKLSYELQWPDGNVLQVQP